MVGDEPLHRSIRLAMAVSPDASSRPILFCLHELRGAGARDLHPRHPHPAPPVLACLRRRRDPHLGDRRLSYAVLALHPVLRLSSTAVRWCVPMPSIAGRRIMITAPPSVEAGRFWSFVFLHNNLHLLHHLEPVSPGIAARPLWIASCASNCWRQWRLCDPRLCRAHPRQPVQAPGTSAPSG